MSTSPSFFFGRTAELAALDHAVRTHRVVTVVGPAGVGKTTLLREFASTVALVVVDLTECDDSVPLESVIAAALSVNFAADADETARHRALAALLDELDGPLALDNAEHLSPSVLALVEHEALSGRSFVVVSRERLGAAHEHVIQLDPFAVTGASPAAVAYLQARATALGATYALRPEETEAAAALVKRLDGLPLAMDLAAARLNLLRPAQLVDRLEQSSDVLSGAGTRSLEAALLSSWDAAESAEREALCALSVLDGPSDPRLAEAVIGEHGLDLLQRLRDRSVVVLDTDGRTRLLLSVRDFVRRRTTEAQGKAAIQRLTTYLAGRAQSWIQAAALLEPIERLSELRAHARHLALAASTDGPDPTAIALCAAALVETALLDGSPAATLEIVRKIAAPDDDAGRLFRLALGRLQRETGRYDEADATFAALGGVDALLERSLTAQYRGELELARRLAEEAAEASETDYDRGRTELLRAGVAFHFGDYNEARERFELAIRHADRATDRRTAARARQNLGVVHTDQMRLELARKCLNEAIESHQSSGDVLREAWGHNSLGVVELRAARADEGIAALERARALFDRIGHRSGAASTLANLAMIAVDAARWDDGVNYAVEALDRSSSEEDPHVSGTSMLCLSVCIWLRGDRAAAGRMFEDFEPVIDGDGHVQLGLSWDAAYGAYLASVGDDRAERVFQRGEARVSDDDGHEIYAQMFRLARCHSALRELHGGADREEVLLQLLNVLADMDVSRSEPLRFTLRLLQNEAPDAWGPILEAAGTAKSQQLLIAPELQAFFVPGSSWHSLARSPSLWRLFEAIARSHGHGPLDQDQLQEAVWPGEVLTVESAANRLHVSLSKLRKMGLQTLLRRTDAGYEFDPSVDVAFF